MGSGMPNNHNKMPLPIVTSSVAVYLTVSDG